MSIKCAGCGRFISYADIDAGRANYHEHREIADEYGGIREEEYFLCADCEAPVATRMRDK